MLKQFHNLLKTLEQTQGSKDKITIIAKALDQEPELGRLFELALSPYNTFGVAKIKEPPHPWHQYHTGKSFTWRTLLEALESRSLTGNSALVEISIVRHSLDFEQQNAFDRILLKDLRCGVAAETVNKARPGTVPVFSCQLAMSEMPKLSELTLPIYAEPKLDGVRTIAIKRNGVVKLYSRNGKEFENFAEIVTALDRMKDNYVLDGELISPDGFAALMTRAKAKPGVATDVPVVYCPFDGMSLSEWDAQNCRSVFTDRRTYTNAVIYVIGDPLVATQPHRKCLSLAEIEAFYAEQLALGFEGIMLKYPDSHYTFKRNKAWMKFKPFDTADLKVVGVVEGQGKYVGSLGALVCEGEHQGKKIRTEVGSGFTDAMRDDFWGGWHSGLPGAESGKVLKGRVAEIRYQEITKAQDSDHFSLRFPTFVRWRDDK